MKYSIRLIISMLFVFVYTFSFSQTVFIAPKILQGSAFANRVETYATVGTDVLTFYHSGNFSIPVQAFTGVGIRDGAGVIGTDVAFKYDFAFNSSVFFGLGLPVPYDKLTAADFSSAYFGLCAGIQFQFAIGPLSTPNKSATIISK